MADTDNVRFGVSALDLDYADQAEKDELLVRGTDGQMLYKRLSDGHIVTPTSLIYNKELLMNALKVKFAGDGLLVNKTDFLVYNSIAIAGANSLESTNVVSFGITKQYNISLDTPTFLVRVRATDVTTAVVSYIEKKSMVMDAEDATCLLTFNVRETDSSGSVTSYKQSVRAKFDDLTLIRLTPSVSDVMSITVTPLTVQFPDFKNILADVSSELLAEIRGLNYNNVNLEADCVDFITVTNEISSPTIYDNSTHTRLNYILTMAEVIEGINGDSEAIVVSDAEPLGDCIWIRPKTT